MKKTKKPAAKVIPLTKVIDLVKFIDAHGGKLGAFRPPPERARRRPGRTSGS
jgi:hypothetical protein